MEFEREEYAIRLRPLESSAHISVVCFCCDGAYELSLILITFPPVIHTRKKLVSREFCRVFRGISERML